jgi:uncharacterized membrane protein
MKQNRPTSTDNSESPRSKKSPRLHRLKNSPSSVLDQSNPINPIIKIAEISIVSALYVALTVLVTPISYGPIQFRISEAVIILVAARPHLILFVPIGCFVANLFSPYAGFWDWIFMPLVSTLGALPIYFFKRRYLLATAWLYAVVTAVGVGFMLSVLLQKGFLVLTLPVLVSQTIIMTLAYFLYKGYFILLKK